jgi:acetoin utilization deacetylase AcuC-like enzyme
MPVETADRVRLFYRDEYVYYAVEAGIRHTFDVERPRRIRDGLLATGLVTAADFVSAPAVSDAELLLVHTPAYVKQIKRPDRLASFLLLDPAHPWDGRLLQSFAYAAGATIVAAREAVAERLICVNLGGGFHHAQADKAEGFCAIADVAIAIRCLQRVEAVERVLIVDLDYHHGNGNASIFARDESVFTFSMHVTDWCRIVKRNNLDVHLPVHASDATYLGLLREHLPGVIEAFDPDLAFYVAGSDPFVEDTLGDAEVSEEGLLERDRFVTRELWGRDVPMVVVTAGGYGRSSWRIYRNYFAWLLSRQGTLHAR